MGLRMTPSRPRPGVFEAKAEIRPFETKAADFCHQYVLEVEDSPRGPVPAYH